VSDHAADSIVEQLRNEISVITGLPAAQISADESLADNGINSMGFIELLLFVERTWGIKLMEAGVGSGDVKSVNALASRLYDLIHGK